MAQLTGSQLKTFVGAQDFETSKEFYIALGWKLCFDSESLSELAFMDCKFYLQRYYQEDWCNNSMLHMTVDDAEAWYHHIQEVLEKKAYGAARVKPPKVEGYGALVTHFWDPSGVLWHLAQPLEQ